MYTWDIILLVVLGYFIYRGARAGFIMTVGWLAGILAGAWIAGRYYDTLAQVLVERLDISIMAAIVIAFIALYVIVNIVVGIGTRIITLVFKFIPLASSTNRFIGAAVGMGEGLLFVGLILWVVTLFPFDTAWTRSLGQSQVARYFIATAAVIQPFLPKDLRSVNFELYQALRQSSPQAAAEYLREHMPKIFERLEAPDSKREQTGEATE